MLNERNTRVDIIAVGLLALTLFVAVSLFTYDRADRIGELVAPLDRIYQADSLVYPANKEIQNACGFLGALTADVLFSGLGLAAFFVLMGMAAVGITLIYRQTIEAIWSRTIGWVLALLGVATVLQLLIPDWTMGPVIGSGGYVGALTKGMLATRFAFAGSMIVTAGLLTVGLLMWTDYWILRWFGWMGVAVGATFTYLVPLELLRPERDDAEVDTSRRGQKRKLRTDDLSGAAEEQVNKSRKSVLEEYEQEQGEQESEEVDEALGEVEDEDIGDEAETESDWDSEDELDFDAEDDVEDVDAPPAKTIPFILKTAAKNALIPKALRRKPKAETTLEATVERPATATTLKGPHFDIQDSDSLDANEDKTNPRDEVIESLNAAAEFEDAEDYQLPSIDLLIPADSVSTDGKKQEALRKGKLLEKAFHSFGLKVRVVDYETGPVITQFELDLDPGLRLSKITGLAHDIAIALRVPSVRVVAPIPGKNTVGIEVPNDTRQTVRLREVMEDSRKKLRKMKIPLFLGKDVAGDPMIADLATLPHLLIAGRTGTGKSVCLNAIISSILMTRRPDEVRMLMIDPKMVELSGYARLPHLMHPVVTDMRKAEAILAWAVDKMEERYRLLASVGVRHVSTYNQLSKEEIYDRLEPLSDEDRETIPLNLPFIVIVADEIADLMMTSGKEVEQHIIRLAQKSRAVGIHLILATQKPTVDVITGLIKSNLPARISFQVASRTDSRVVLDEMGAEKLLGNGDMLFLWPGTSTLLRGQGTFLSDDEIQAVTDEVSTTEQNFVNELINLKVEDDDASDVKSIKERDERYHEAVETVINGQRGSISLIQKNLGIGYGRAARLVDFMEEDGIVGTYAGSKSREVLVTMAQWEQMLAGGDNSNVQPENIEPKGPPASPHKPPKTKQGRVKLVQAIVEDEAESELNDPQIIEPDLEDAEEAEYVEADEDEYDKDEQAEPESDRSSTELSQPGSGGVLDVAEEVEEDVEEDSEEDVEYEYEYVDEDELEDGEEFEIEYQYVDEEEEEEVQGEAREDEGENKNG